ncbi:Dyp-type peroxidase [Dyadobacter sp. 3J3]|uniref:Dyp-type peroxidase n=1 Tax=Dyadobacter sp. 3J3 TaxID=2606600 RepID=UPI001359C8CA|nr:Dyp-type peroxidase [Dyadobacter sp. 3J3]
MIDLLNQTNVSADDEMFTDLLSDLQGNILKFHGRTHAYHLFVRFIPERIVDVKSWLSGFYVTSSSKQLQDAKIRETDPMHDGGTFLNISLSASGYEALGIPLNETPDDPAFRAGIKSRTGITGDDLFTWENDFNNHIDALIIVADSNISTVTRERDNILFSTQEFLEIVKIQKGKILRIQHAIGIEHFGYADGVSQPNFLANSDSPATQWEDNGALLSTLIVPEPTGGPETFGSYFVFRKLDQNVKKFKAAEEELSKSINFVSNQVHGVFNKHGVQNSELAGAMIVGRFEDGTIVTSHSDEMGVVSEGQLENDFDYRDDTSGMKCPFHAHIRITNPRQDVTADFAKSVRLTRRGIPYNDIGRDEFNLDGDQPDGGVGLLFMCYQSSIERQFEFIQQAWVNNGEIGPGNFVGQDALIGQGPNTTAKFLSSQWNTANDMKPVPTDFKDFVTMKGGEYFFTPSISFLRSLETME